MSFPELNITQAVIHYRHANSGRLFVNLPKDKELIMLSRCTEKEIAAKINDSK
jgi:hypothetical protein